MTSQLTVEEMFPADGTITDHIASKEMWAGSISRIDSEELIAELTVGDGSSYSLTKKKLCVSPALIKMFDEAVVNISDHVARMHKNGNENPVTLVKFNMTENGIITLYNNGQGVPTDYHSVAKMYAPQLIFGEAFKGSNLKKETKLDIGGGTNGIGIKITNTHSINFTLSTAYLHPGNGKLFKYKQQWENGMKIVHDPVISSSSGSARDTYTEITFTPNYERFGYSTENHADMKEVSQLFIARMHMLAAYIGWFSKSRASIMINGRQLRVKSMKTLAECMFAEQIKKNEVKIIAPSDGIINPSFDGDEIYPWEFVTAISTTSPFSTKNKDDFCRLSNVNSVVVSSGNHLNKFRNAIVKQVREKLSEDLKVEMKTIAPSQIYKYIYMFMNSTIPNVSWGGGQTKESIQINKKRIMQYNVPDNVISEICGLLRNKIAADIFPLDHNVSLSTEFSKALNNASGIEKYYPAKFAGKRGTKKCKQKVYLLIAEGDSAQDHCRDAMMTKDGKTGKTMLDPDYYGMYTFGGNVINARKNILREIHSSKGSKTEFSHSQERMFLNEKLENNTFFLNFVKIMGLRFDYKYDPTSPTFKEEYASLNYDYIASCTDQDFDGVGKIFTLFANIVMLFWPNLINLKFVNRLETPSRRAYPKGGGKVLEFYGDYDCDRWMEENPTAPSKYNIKFFKGLATNEKPEMAHIFKNFEKNLLTYYADDKTPQLFEDHFGKDPEKRKVILETPTRPPTVEQLELRKLTRKVNFNDHLDFERKEFMFSDLIQKLCNQYDGFNEVGRKIACGLLKLIKSPISEKRVSQLGSYVQTKMQYHHGEHSIQESIFSMGFVDVGGVQLPLVVLIGNGGTRGCGGSRHGSARYVNVVPNKPLLNALFPRDLIAFAKDKLEDGEPAEKEILMGIIPRGICESVEIPSNGYKIKIHARDVFSVINSVKGNILRYKEGMPQRSTVLAPYTRGFTGEIIPIHGRLHSFGRYKFNKSKRLLTVTELPLRVWYLKYVEKLISTKTYVRRPYSQDEKDLVRIISGEIFNRSSSDDISIEITIADPNNGWDPLDIIDRYALDGYYDGFVGYFGLKKRMDDQLFMTREDGSVETKFKTYEEILVNWFPKVKDLYLLRAEREEAILDLKIKCLKQHIRYVTEYDSLNITKKETEIAEKILSSNNYTKYNHTYLKTVASKTDTATEIYHNVMNVNTSFDYLFNTTDYMKHLSNISKMQKKLANLEKEYEEYLRIINEPPFKGARLWMQDLYELENVCKEGFKTNWKYGAADIYTYA